MRQGFSRQGDRYGEGTNSIREKYGIKFTENAGKPELDRRNIGGEYEENPTENGRR